MTTRGRRIVFLDIDGTLAHQGVVPASHADAVRRARAAGHLLFLCTGRPLSMIPPQIRGIGFDGVVASAGAYVQIGADVLRDTRFPDDAAAHTVSVLDDADAAFILEAPEVYAGRTDTIPRLQRAFGGRRPSAVPAALRELLDGLTVADDLGDISFAKLVYFDTAVSAEEIQARLDPRVALLPDELDNHGGPPLNELYLAGVTKAQGAALVVARYGVGLDDVVAIGDGLNDLELLEQAGTSIAVEGSDPRVLAVAGDRTPPPDQEGLVPTFARLGLLVSA